MSDIRTALDAHLRAAEADGRPLTDSEASLIDVIASLPDPEPARVPSLISPPVTVEFGDGLLPTAADRGRLVEAIRTRSPLTVEAAAVHYDTHSNGARAAAAVTRLATFLTSRGASVADVARKVDVPVIETGDAAEWGGNGASKALVVTALTSVPSKVYAAYTEVESLSMIDLSNLDRILSALLGRRVVASENSGLASQIGDAGQAGIDATDAHEAVANAIVEASKGGTNPNVLLLSSKAAAAVLSAAQAGYSGQGTWNQTLYGIDYLIVPGMLTMDVVAADATALSVAATPILTLVDPYSSSKTNGVLIRVETSTAGIVLDPHAVAHTSITTAAARTTK